MKIKTTIYIHHVQYHWEDKGEFAVFSCKLGNEEHRTYVGEQEIEIEIPDNFDPRPAKIAALQRDLQKAAADYQKSVTDIQRRISELQAISFTA